MKYCRNCITPDTRPNIEFDKTGICNACASHAMKREIDWEAREKLFQEVVQRTKSKSRGYDCVIGVSGGKDSTWQLVKCLEYGLNPLAVTWKTPARTEIGTKNLENLIRLGVDHIDYQVNPQVEKKFMYDALVRDGSTAIPMHMAIYNIPHRIASKFDIPLVVWGENGAFEYGCSDKERKGFVMDQQWLKKHGVTHGATLHDYISEHLTERELTPYVGPDDKELKKKGILSIFLGYYFQWDPASVLQVALKNGFQPSDKGPKTGYYNFADIDDDFISIHHFLKWYKFGFTRLFDNLSLEIRNGRLSREQAIQIVRETGDQTPHEDIEKFCKFVGITKQHFFEIIEKFRNLTIWTKQDGKWVIKNFLIPDWSYEAQAK